MTYNLIKRIPRSSTRILLASKAKLRVQPHLTLDGEDLLCERQYRNAEAPPLWAKAGNIDGPANGWTKWRYHPPSVIMFDVGWEGVTPQAGQPALRIRTSHGITPETQHSTHHFWFSTRNFAISDPQVTETLSSIRRTFSEDVAIVEKTHLNKIRFSDLSMVHFASDAPTMQARRLVANLLQKERSAGGP